MKILVLSDSHASLYTMRRCVERFAPDAIIYLGDYFDDGQVIAEENPHIPFYAVPGNCDRYRTGADEPATKLEIIDGVRFLLTHGHLHLVKQSMAPLLADARASRVQAVLFGHTHNALCCLEDDGLWVVNPGSCGYGGGTAALIETTPGHIHHCRILREI